MFPRMAPRQPTTWELQDNGRAFPPNYLHESWRDYLYWDSGARKLGCLCRQPLTTRFASKHGGDDT